MKKILFIEDESALQKTLGTSLAQEGYQIISATNGEEGLQMAKSQEPDLILLDLILPKMNGFEVLENLRKDNVIKDIPVVVLTNLETSGDIGKVIELGATSYLVKTQYSLEELTHKVKDILEGGKEE